MHIDEARQLANDIRKTVLDIGAGANSDLPAPANTYNKTPSDAQTIEVDGVIRSTTNANGQWIAPTEQGLRNFWRWFGDSKVVDEQGRPRMVYHWTDNDFTEFDMSMSGEGAHFGTKKAAMDRARGMADIGYEIEEENGQYFVVADSGPKADDWQGPFTTKQQAISFRAQQPKKIEPMALYLSTKNPVRLPDLGTWSALDIIRAMPEGTISTQEKDAIMDADDRYSALRKTFLDKGIDGIVYKNEVEDKGRDSYIAFSPTQIKSATGNIVTFDKSNPNILKQSAYHGTPYRGITTFSTDKIGSGEGAQAYGWGLYFAAKKEIAEYYRAKLSNPAEVLGWHFEQNEEGSWVIYTADDEIVDAFDTEEEAEALIESKGAGQVYRVEIPEDDDLLDYEKPLNEQSGKVRTVSEPFRQPDDDPDARGSDLYFSLKMRLGSAKAASEALAAAGIKGIKYLDGTSRDGGNVNYNYVIFSGDDVAIQQQFYQRNAGQMRGGFDPDRLATILTEQADFSTFLHETAHFFLTVYSDMATKPNAPEQMKADMQTLLDWFGVKDLATWNAMPIEQQRQYHEQFAYNYEIYLSEGQAPNAALQPMFDRFSTWMKGVYRSIRDDLNEIYKQEHGTDLPIMTGEVRSAMERMLANDRQGPAISDDPFAQSSREVEQQLLDQLIAANQPSTQASAYAVFVRHFVDTHAAAFNTTPEEIFSQYLYRVEIAEQKPPRSTSEQTTLNYTTEPTIDVDGVSLPTRNSKGQPIATTEEATRNFWRWFGKSAAIDEQGRPLVIYHGTDADFAIFNKGGGDFGPGYYMTSDAAEASDYANDWNPTRARNGANVMPVYASLQNPYIVQPEDRRISGDEIKKKAGKSGHDGIIRKWKNSDQIHAVAFSPNQIKSATGNTGAFCATNPSILKQSACDGTPYRHITQFSTDTIGTGAGNPQIVFQSEQIADVNGNAPKLSRPALSNNDPHSEIELPAHATARRQRP